MKNLYKSLKTLKKDAILEGIEFLDSSDSLKDPICLKVYKDYYISSWSLAKWYRIKHKMSYDRNKRKTPKYPFLTTYTLRSDQSSYNRRPNASTGEPVKYYVYKVEDIAPLILEEWQKLKDHRAKYG